MLVYLSRSITAARQVLSSSGTRAVFVCTCDVTVSVCWCASCACCRQSKPGAKQSKKGRRRRQLWLGPRGQTPTQTWTPRAPVKHSSALLVCCISCAVLCIAACTWLTCCACCASASTLSPHQLQLSFCPFTTILCKTEASCLRSTLNIA